MAFLSALLAFLLSLAAPPRVEAEASGAPRPGEVTVSLAAQALAAAPRRDDPPILGSSNPNRPLVVIDPGHGGRDPGAVSPHDGTAEKGVVLELARAIRDELVRSGRVRVAITRDEDRFIPLRERYEIARRLRADLFVSVHADAAPSGDSARGATVYTLSEVASDAEAAALAARENKSDIIGGVDLTPRDATVNAILIDLAQRESMDQSAQFARLLHREASAIFPFRQDYHRFASLVVLKAPDIPSILLEAGYMTNQEDSAFVQSPEGRRRIATGMRRAIEAHFARRNLQIASR